MFQLIAAVIAVILLAIIVIAALWFGGGAYTESNNRARYAEYMNAASQIDGAMQLYYNDHAALPAGQDEVLINSLISNKYLTSPPNGEWKVSATELYRRIEGADQCEIMNRLAGHDTSTVKCPPCGDEQYKKWPGCMQPATTTP